jgi:hypothetical protein
LKGLISAASILLCVIPCTPEGLISASVLLSYLRHPVPLLQLYVITHSASVPVIRTIDAVYCELLKSDVKETTKKLSI